MIEGTTELEVALAAVRSAANVCREVQKRLVTAETLQKKDKSPVTVADFASQAIVCAHLEERLPDDLVVGEEDSADLRGAESATLRAAVADRVRGELAQQPDEEAVLRWIDRGGAGADTARYWTLDPIDGTKGFLRGEQYAVALGLIEDGEVVLGVLGCPNLPSGETQPGVLFAGVAGQGARAYSLWDAADMEGREVSVAQIASAADARFCESVESGHSDQGVSARIAAILGISSEPYRIDSQCKYAAVARNDASIYLRLPTRKDYQEKIWDHAAGMKVVECAGGRVTDVHGRELDFRQGRTLANNRGIVATCGAIHDEVIEAIARVRAELEADSAAS